MNKSVERLSEVITSVTMQSVSMQDLEQFSYWQDKRLSSYHCYDIYNPVISVDLTELADRVVGNNDSVEESGFTYSTTTCRHESLLTSTSDALLRALQRWITNHGYPMRSRCYISLQAVVPLPLPLTGCLGVLTNIPIFAFFPWTVSLSRSFLAMLDWLSYKWLMTQIQSPCMEFKLVITLIHENNGP